MNVSEGLESKCIKKRRRKGQRNVKVKINE